ncbi:MAG: PLP-dependent aminotransferase family protein [Victivallales bacterium]|nr:PLP-dependent aminotransferase family protein [Victivallales bacterium]MCF7889149.1 PLP-dependent aminotransferase family protein [Victivallales bacterium]
MEEQKIVQLKIPEGIISFRMGQPSMSVLPEKLIRKASAQFYDKYQYVEYLQYGNKQGSTPFRKKLADFLSDKYECDINYSDLQTTYGATSAIDFLSTLLTKPGDTVFVEDPTYFIISKIFKDHNLNIISIPCDQYGMKVDVLEQKIKKFNPVIVYTIPIFQNPSSSILSEERRVRLSEICSKNNAYIIADEVYHLLDYKENRTPKPMYFYDRFRNVISIGSFSKILAPGLRSGWIHTLNRKIINVMAGSGMLFSGGGMNPLISGNIMCAIETGLLDDHLSFLKTTYLKRLNILADELQKQLGDYVEFIMPRGGFYIWAKAKNNESTQKLAEIGEKFKVSIMPGANCSVNGNFDDYMRLSVSYLSNTEIIEGVKRLKKVFAEYHIKK